MHGIQGNADAPPDHGSVVRLVGCPGQVRLQLLAACSCRLSLHTAVPASAGTTPLRDNLRACGRAASACMQGSALARCCEGMHACLWRARCMHARMQARAGRTPEARQLARMALAGLPRGGGDGDAIRHGILNVMRENGIREGHRPVRVHACIASSQNLAIQGPHENIVGACEPLACAGSCPRWMGATTVMQQSEACANRPGLAGDRR